MVAWRPLLACSVIVAAVWMPTSAANADKRVALIIGNSNYHHIPSLPNPVNDARLMADTLRTLGFALIGGGAHVNLDKLAIESVVRRFGAQLQGADVGLFYYAGHGVQVRGANYLVPVGANTTREVDVDFDLADTALVLRQMEAAGTRLNIVLLDACRNNPFGGRGLRTVERGLARMRAPEGTLISFATQPGSVAQDGIDGNSPFTKALAQTIRKPGLGIFDAINEVGLAVKRATGGAQQPWFSTSPIDGSFYFAGLPYVAAAAPPAMIDPCAAASDHWRSAEAMNSRAAFEDHLARFPNCAFVGLARARIQAMASAAAFAPQTAQPPASVRPPPKISAPEFVATLTPPPSPVPSLVPTPLDAIDIVREFYSALGRADGKKASSLVIPEKRASGAFNSDQMTKFYSSLVEPLRLIDVVSLGNNKFQATYAFRARARVCDGTAIVSVVKRSGQSYIESIKALKGC